MCGGGRGQDRIKAFGLSLCGWRHMAGKNQKLLAFGDRLCYDVKQFIVMAWNGTLVRGSDRNAASPTESAACVS